MLILSGKAEYMQEGSKSVLNPGTWGFVCANSKVNSFLAIEDTEVLANFYSAVAFLKEDGSVDSLLTALDVMQMAKDKKIILVPNSLEACMEIEGEQYSGNGEPLAIASENAGNLVNSEADITKIQR